MPLTGKDSGITFARGIKKLCPQNECQEVSFDFEMEMMKPIQSPQPDVVVQDKIEDIIFSNR